ncbi:MAG: A/G-specific adenine glycosylase [Myxococcota bacterium]
MSEPFRLDDTSADRIRGIRAPLLRWYDANRRDLPWRRTRDPYAIWISEAMLQQTRVETVIPYWERFLDRFPDIASLARAELDEVYAVWTGLGYYSRARNLKAAAESVVRDHGGRLPDDAESLRGLRGIGRYTAGAIASIAFDREEPLVDGNVIRVLARVLGIRADSTRRDVVEAIWSVAGRLVRGTRPGDLNQALMELGATTCTPRSPACLACPIRSRCDAHAAGDAETLPIKPKKAKQKPMRAVAVWIEREGRILAVRRPEEGLMAGLWELPGGEIGTDEAPSDRVAEVLRRHVGLELRSGEPGGSVEHLFTHRRLALDVFRARPVPGGRVRREGFVAHRWLRPEALLELAHAGATRKALALFGVTNEVSARAARDPRDRTPRRPRGASARP